MLDKKVKMCGRSRYFYYLRKRERPLKLGSTITYFKEAHMSFSSDVKNTLISEVVAMASTPESYCKNPEKDFTRTRKMTLRDVILLPILKESGTMRQELLKYFDYNPSTLTNSAYCQQRKKLKTDVHKQLFFNFNSHYNPVAYEKHYRLLAADGSTFTYTKNPDDVDSYYPPDGKSSKGFNEIHVNALFDLESQRYVDAVIQPIRKKNEFKALTELIDNYKLISSDSLKPIFIADRGFCSYNVFAHAIENDAYFLIRDKDINISRLTGYDSLPESFDIDKTIILTKTHSKKAYRFPDKADLYKNITKSVSFDYITDENPDYEISLRVLRFKVADGSYENIVTNLPRNEFTSLKIKELYNKRWGIETSFCKLKHALGAEYFHSKEQEYITQEIWAKLILFNYCSIITLHVVIEDKKRKFKYQVNYTVAYNACLHFLKQNGAGGCDLESLIGQNILPIRPNRNYARQHRFQIPVSFTYR